MYVISYDLSNDKLRNQVAKELKNYGKRVQYSVFECRISKRQMMKLYEKLLLITQKEEEEELKQLQLELQEHSYETLPVRSTMLYKGEKMRMIALYSMRDKVVQQSLAVELNRIYDNSFSNQTYAYRNNRSALSAVYEIEKRIQTEKYAWILKADISKFFDMIQWEQLKAIFKRTIFAGF